MSVGSVGRLGACAVVLAAAAVLAAALPSGPLRATVVLFALWTVPGIALLRTLPRRREGWIDLGLALALSPFLVGALVTGLLYAGFTPALAGALALLAGGSALVWTMLGRPGLPRREGPTDVESPSPAPRPAAFSALLLLLTAFLVLSPAYRSNRVRASIHGMLHASILYSAAENAPPPENPFFAGEPLRYYWTWHAAAAAGAYLGSVEPTWVFTSMNTAALVAFLLLLAGLGLEIWGNNLATFLTALVGFSSLGAAGLVRTHFARPLATLDEIAQGVDPINYIKAFTLHDDRISVTLTKFLNVSSFPCAFALLAATWLLWRRFVGRPSAVGAVLLALAQAGSIVLSPITGAVGGLALGAVTLLRLTGSERRASLVAAGALLGGLLLSAPLVATGMGEEEDLTTERVVALESDPALAREKLEDALFALGPALLPALVAAGWLGRRRRRDDLLLLGAGLLLLVLGVALHFPVRSEYKMVRMAAPLVGLFAAGWAVPLARRRRLAGSLGPLLLLGLFAPSSAAVWNVYRRHAEAHLPYFGEGPLIRIDAAAHPVAEAYDWLRTEAPRDAVVLVDPRSRLRHHFAGPHHGEETPVLAHRPVYTDLGYYMTDYEPTFPRRSALVGRLFGRGSLAPGDYQALASLRRPIFLLARAYDPGFTAAVMGVAQDGHWKQVLRTKAAVLYRLVR